MDTYTDMWVSFKIGIQGQQQEGKTPSHNCWIVHDVFGENIAQKQTNPLQPSS